MCDEREMDDMIEHTRRSGELSRRGFTALTVGAGLTALLPHSAEAAVAVTESDVEIKTADGSCDAYFVRPARGKHAAVLIWPDAFGLRPAFRAMGKRLAEAGYSVLVPNQFYRSRRAPILPAGASFQDPDTRNTLMALMGSLNPATQLTDATAFIGFLDKQRSVDRRKKMATTGYCMGGPITMRTAASFPDRIGAAASFHGGGLATDKPDSPHLLVPKMRSQYLIAIAENDDAREPQAKELLRQAFDQAKLTAEIEVYAGTQHGWCPPDAAVYNATQAERAWERMLALFAKTLA